MEHAIGDGKRRVAEALWRVVARDGMTGVSVRTVAAEGGVKGGTVQHYFPSRAQMVHYAMEMLADQFTQRITAMPRTGPTYEWTRAFLLELLPLTAERQREFRVWLAFTTHADTNPALTELKHSFSTQLGAMYQRILRARRAASHGMDEGLHHEVNPSDDSEAAVLQAVIDGLSLQLADLDPDEAAGLGPLLLDHYLAKPDADPTEVDR
ncbi:MAG TPA: hypothetical protein DIW46_14045 [Microbacterium sp.]|uniref:TetR/AcrR family transcriptional regulator n=1 Tax=Microbacterium sp. TaxID=51671 RepID=UPI000EE8F069|nr:hypothetical protein [Microbacterium sp.]